MDLSPFRELARATGPFATVYLDVSHDTTQAAKQIDLRWQSARASLAEQGADPPTLAALDRALTEALPAVGRAGRALVAGGGKLWLDEPLRMPPPQPLTHYGALPDLGPLLAGRTPGIAHVVAVIDRTGADLRGFAADGSLAASPEVEGDRHPVHKVGGGGLSHGHIQHRVEETWHANAKQVAEEIDRLVGELNAQLVVLAGEPKSRADVRDSLNHRCATIAVELSGASRADANEETVTEAVQSLVANIAAAHGREIEERFVQELNRPGGHAVSGLPEVTAALRMSTVDTLLMDPEAERAQQIWVGDQPTQLAVAQEELRDLGVPNPRPEPADAALLRATAATGAQLQMTPGLRDGVAALLRS
ncbi:Vms1/Ankzf1 family peptidyl-tRNA hydrolase [Crossiella sp. CA-258035]|uniref:Rv2629 family ribosome hibernation factor n=1 Tax=Crossiella sp. CA-258035 TaxID=2981138 RepID=UPI0024BD03A1|nr:Vms1/Ankzf1 family peptidyl-tRNA hydrolase [Crossiella sp. CA-258035]WHT16912.1 Vms1/Ankzf1 family peptidyl-tRNA hydrolase [Crossiella sp. CA-258035]